MNEQLNLFADNVGQDVSGVTGFIERQHQLIERDLITDIDFGPWGVKWRGADVQNPNSMYENDFTSIFGFTCAGCGVSVVNQEKLKHKKDCDSKNPMKHYEENENE